MEGRVLLRLLDIRFAIVGLDTEETSARLVRMSLLYDVAQLADINWIFYCLLNKDPEGFISIYSDTIHQDLLKSKKYPFFSSSRTSTNVKVTPE